MAADSIKDYAESLRIELVKRRLEFMPIDWWTGHGGDRPADLELKAKPN